MLIRVPQGNPARIIELQPVPQEVERSEPESSADITLLLSKKNRVAIQDPTVQEYRDDIDPSVLSALRLRWTKPKFLALATTVTCMPDPGCRFTFLRIEYDLGLDLSREQRPVACTLYPESGEHTVQVVETAETSASLAFKVTTVESPGITSKSGITETHERRYRSVVAFGRTGPKPGWDFKTTPVCNEIAGDISLLLMVSCDANIKANAEISVSATVQLQSGGLNVPFLTSRSKSDVAKLQFPLA